VTNASWNAFATLWSIVTSLAVAPVLIHNIGTTEYGILLLVWSFTAILGLLGFGFGEAMLRYVAHYFGEGSLEGVTRVMRATLSFYMVVCAAVFSALFLAAPMVVSLFNIPSSDYALFTSLLRLSALIFALRSVTLTYGAVPMALHRYDISSKINILQNVLRTGGIILLALCKYDIFYLVLWEAITQAVTLLAHVIVVRRISPAVSLMPSLSFKGLSEIAGFSVFSFLTYVFHMMQREAWENYSGSSAWCRASCVPWYAR
jgi:O-antigen/teichoic acid export membrane protein